MLSERLERWIDARGVATHVQIRPDAWCLQQQSLIAASPHGSALQRLARQLSATRRRRHVHDRRGARHGDRLGERADFQDFVDPRGEAGCQAQALPPDGLEAQQGVLHRVGANRKRSESIFAALVRDVDQLRHL